VTSPFREALNAVDWADLGFICDGRYCSASAASRTPRCGSFRIFLPDRGLKTHRPGA
jgi:adenine-specific DNA-methyltransferase